MGPIKHKNRKFPCKGCHSMEHGTKHHLIGLCNPSAVVKPTCYCGSKTIWDRTMLDFDNFGTKLCPYHNHYYFLDSEHFLSEHIYYSVAMEEYVIPETIEIHIYLYQ